MVLYTPKLIPTLIHFYLIFILLGSWLASAQSISDLPPCGKGCASNAAQAAGCALSDIACLCKTNSFTSATAQCASQVCQRQDQGTVSAILSKLCSAATTTSSTTSTSQSSTAPQSSTSKSSTTPNTGASNTGTTSPTNTPSSRGTTQNGQTTVVVTTSVTTTATSSFNPLTLPSSAVTTPDSTSVVLQTVTSSPSPSGNSAQGIRIANKETLGELAVITVLGIVLGSLAAL